MTSVFRPEVPAPAPLLESEVRVYGPGLSRGWGPAVWRGMVSELVASRELIWRLFVRDFSVRYRQTALGVLWALIMPIFVVGAFAFLNRSGVVRVGETGIPYPAYAILGLTVWQIFAGGLTAATNALAAGGSLIAKINFPKETLVIAALGQTLFETAVRLGLVTAIFAYYRVVPAWPTLLFPFAILPLLALTLGLGLLLSLLQAWLKDVTNVVTLVTTFLLFLTPVLYPSPPAGLFAELSRYNPLAVLVNVPRDLVIQGTIGPVREFAVISILSALVFLVCWRVFHLAEERIAKVIGTS